MKLVAGMFSCDREYLMRDETGEQESMLIPNFMELEVDALFIERLRKVSDFYGEKLGIITVSFLANISCGFDPKVSDDYDGEFPKMEARVDGEAVNVFAPNRFRLVCYPKYSTGNEVSESVEIEIDWLIMKFESGEEYVQCA